MRGRVKLLQMRDSQAKIFHISFLTGRKLNFWPPHSTQSCCCDWGGLCSRDLDERWGSSVPWAGQNEEGTSKSHPWTRKRCDFHPWESFMFRQATENCKFPWVPEDFLCTREDELAAPRRAKGALTPNSSRPWLTGSLIPLLFLFTAGFWAFSKLLLTGNSLF